MYGDHSKTAQKPKYITSTEKHIFVTSKQCQDISGWSQ